MTNPIISIHNLETGEIGNREMTDEEYARYQDEMSTLKLETEQRAAKDAARQAILTKLGLTADEVAALLG